MIRFVARATDLVVEELDTGLVVYDKRSDQAHWLDASAATVWRACREQCTEAEIATASGLDPQTCEIALAYLVDRGLVETDSPSAYSRRVILRTAAKVGVGGAVAAPIISAIVPVAAAHASSGGGGGGGGGGSKTHTFTVQSGNGAYGAPDPSNSVFFSPSQLPGPPPPFPAGGSTFNVPTPSYWGLPISPSNWISIDPNGATNFSEPVGYYYYTYTPGITIPPGASDVSVTGSFMSDNGSQVFIDNSQVGDNSSSGTGSYTTPSSFGTTGLAPGQHTLQFQVYNDGGPTGLDFFGTVTYTL